MASEICNLLDDVRKFIEAEYADPAVAPDGEWLAKEARHIHNKVCTALANGSESLSRTGAVEALEWVEAAALGGARKLIALDCFHSEFDRIDLPKSDAEIASLKAAAQTRYEACILSALEPAEPEGQQEPVAWIYRRRDGTTVVTRDNYADWRRYYESRGPLYTRPSEQAVTDAMVNAAADEIVNIIEIDFNGTVLNRRETARATLKAAMESRS